MISLRSQKRESLVKYLNYISVTTFLAPTGAQGQGVTYLSNQSARQQSVNHQGFLARTGAQGVTQRVIQSEPLNTSSCSI